MEEEAPVGRCARAEELHSNCSAAKRENRRGGGDVVADNGADNGADEGAAKGGDAEWGAGRRCRGGVACGGMGQRRWRKTSGRGHSAAATLRQNGTGAAGDAGAAAGKSAAAMWSQRCMGISTRRRVRVQTDSALPMRGTRWDTVMSARSWTSVSRRMRDRTGVAAHGREEGAAGVERACEKGAGAEGQRGAGNGR
jgi:hypothetical protein